MRWMNFSGAPALLVHRAALRAWHGILERDDARPGTADFDDAAGGRWWIHDAFDFAHPVTHYDHLCAELGEESVRLLRVGGHDALALSDGSDVFAWWAERCAIVSNTTTPPSAAALDAAEWRPIGELVVDEESLILMNASVHGGQILDGDEASEHDAVTLDLGRWRVESARIDAATVLRFVPC